LTGRRTDQEPQLTPDERIAEAYRTLGEAADALGRIAHECLDAAKYLRAFRSTALPMRGPNARPKTPTPASATGPQTEDRGSWLYQRRTELGLTQGDLAIVLGIEQWRVSYLERGKARARPAEWQGWAEAMRKLKASRRSTR